jgi:hypothetical protein
MPLHAGYTKCLSRERVAFLLFFVVVAICALLIVFVVSCLSVCLWTLQPEMIVLAEPDHDGDESFMYVEEKGPKGQPKSLR